MLEAALFDMDGVVTDTATAHAAAWKRMFDDFLRARAASSREGFEPFDVERDYGPYVDGRSRYDGVTQFLESRGISLPSGEESDPPGTDTVCGLGNRKNRYFHEWLDDHPVRPYRDALHLIDVLRGAGVGTAVFSASRNARAVLDSAGLVGLFDVIFTGAEAASLGLPGKPDPTMLLETARRLQASPAEAAVVEDAAAGVEAAARGGFRPIIGVDRRGRARHALADAGAGMVVRSLAELTWTRDAGFAVKTVDTVPLIDDHQAHLQTRGLGHRLVVFLNVDSPLTRPGDDSDPAVLPTDMRHAIGMLTRCCPVVIVSGRDVDVVRGVVRLDEVYCAGRHGLDIRGPGGWSRRLETGTVVVDWLLEQLGLDGTDVLPVYVGGQVTDEDAFSVLAGRGLTIAVRDAADRPTSADYAVRGPDDVQRLLERLAALAPRANEDEGGRR